METKRPKEHFKWNLLLQGKHVFSRITMQTFLLILSLQCLNHKATVAGGVYVFEVVETLVENPEKKLETSRLKDREEQAEPKIIKGWNQPNHMIMSEGRHSSETWKHSCRPDKSSKGPASTWTPVQSLGWKSKSPGGRPSQSGEKWHHRDSEDTMKGFWWSNLKLWWPTISWGSSQWLMQESQRTTSKPRKAPELTKADRGAGKDEER